MPMPSEPFADISIAKACAGIAGAFVSLNFMKGPLLQRLTLAAGGALMSYFFSTGAASTLNMRDAEGMIGFLIGMFGMALTAKVYEVIQALDGKVISSDVWGWVKRKWGA